MMMVVMTIMAMTAMLDDHNAFRAGTVPAAFTIALTLTDRDVDTGTRHAALAAHFAPKSLAPLAADLTAHALATLSASFHPALGAIALSAHFTTALLRSAGVALHLTARCCTLIDADAGTSFWSVLREGRRCNRDSRSGGEQITELCHFGFPLKS
jgi:hypothetical protein